MITYKKGDLLKAEVEALVNTVNTVGVMGKGIALQFKNQYPKNYKIYKEACKTGTLRVGGVLVVRDADLLGEKIIINFPTKEHWKAKSKYDFISTGLKALKNALIEHRIKSIALPPLGCGNGGLDWAHVKPMIEQELKNLPVEIQVFEPNSTIKGVLQNEEKPKEAKLTRARAMLLYLMFKYEALGDTSSLFSANKLAYFLQESGEKLRLNFQPHHYGPYAVQLNHVLFYLNGVYLQGLEQNQARPFEPLRLNYDRLREVESFIAEELSTEQRQRLESVINLIEGFESTYALELLASVSYAKKMAAKTSLEEIKSTIKNWSNRKANLFDPEHIEIAYEHLKAHSSSSLFLG